MRKKLILVLLTLLGVVLLSACQGAVDWPGLSTDGDTTYLSNGTYVYAINTNDGTERWHYPFQADQKTLFYANPLATSNGMVVVGSAGVNHELVALQPDQFPSTLPKPVGRVQGILCGIGVATCPDTVQVEAWRFNDAKDRWIASPLELDGKLFAPNADGSIYVLDLANGDLINKITLDGESNQPHRLWSQPVTDGERVFVASLNHTIYAIDATTDKIVWQETLNGAIPGGLVLGSDGMLYVGSFANQLERFDPATGAHEPVLDTKDWIWGTPLVDGDNLYFSDVDGNAYSYNVVDQKLNWEPVQTGSSATASPAFINGKLLLPTESGNVYAVDEQGKISLWFEEPKKGKAYTTPVVSGDRVLVAFLDADYMLLALSEDGRTAWTFPPQQ